MMLIFSTALFAVFFMHSSGVYAAGQGQAPHTATDILTNDISITIGFDGSDLTMYGVKDPSTDVIVVLRGPQKTVKVKKKERTALGWRYSDFMLFKDIPSFYGMVSTAPINNILNDEDREKYEIGEYFLNILPKNTEEKDISADRLSTYKQALIRNQEQKGVFLGEEAPAQKINDQFFKVYFDLPHNVPRGLYVIQIFSLQNNKIIERQWHDVFISQVGFNAAVSKWAIDRSLLYGIICAFIAILAGLFSNRLKRIL